jgi:hypothetical protein
MDNKILYTAKFTHHDLTKFGGNRTKNVEVGPDRRTDRPIPIYPTQTMFAGGIMICQQHFVPHLIL